MLYDARVVVNSVHSRTTVEFGKFDIARDRPSYVEFAELSTKPKFAKFDILRKNVEFGDIKNVEFGELHFTGRQVFIDALKKSLTS